MRKTKVKAAKRLLEVVGDADLGEQINTVFHAKLFRFGSGLILSYRAQYVNVGKRGAYQAAKKLVTERRDGNRG